MYLSYLQCKVVDGEPMTLSKQGELEQYLIPPPPAAATTVPLLGLRVSYNHTHMLGNACSTGCTKIEFVTCTGTLD